MLDTEQRKKISAQLLSTDAILANADASIADAAAQSARVQATDDAVNKPIFAAKNNLVNFYQRERKYFDGITRQEITETDMTNSAALKPMNFFFPNQPTVTVPSIPGNIWTNAIPFALSAAIGKNYTEVYPATGFRTELNIIADLEAQFAIVEAFPELVRITGQICSEDPGDPLALPTPIPASAGVTPYAPMQNAATAINALYAEWVALMDVQKNALISFTDPDSARQTKNTAAIASVNTAESSTNPSWTSLPNFIVVNPGVITTCTVYDATDPNTIGPTKFRSSQLPILKNAVTARKSYLNTTRGPDLLTFLGNITQSTDGTITSKTGLYGERFASINIRLNLVAGDNLITIATNSKRGAAIESGKSGTEDKFDAWSQLLLATSVDAPTSGTEYVQVKDATGFAPGDTFFVTSDTQGESSFVIALVEDNRIKSTTKIPEKFRPEEGARLYKEL